MPRVKQEGEKFPDNLSMLDDLIRRYYRELLKTVDEHVKLGDFIKMIELRRKLAPGDSEQKQFWKMLEKIRQETLGQDKVKQAAQKRRAPRKQKPTEQ